MSAAQATSERISSPGLKLNLSSNNPFRTTSPALASPAPGATRPVSRNPFLASFEQDGSPKKSFDSQRGLNEDLLGAPATNTNGNSARLPLRAGPPPNRGPPTFRTRPSLDEDRARRPSQSEEPVRRTGGLPPQTRAPAPRRRPVEGEDGRAYGDERRPGPRPRRNSESSVLDRPPMSDEERRRRERRRREYEARKRAEKGEGTTGKDEKDKDNKAKDGESKPKSSSRRKPHGLDIIDKLDVTGIYGAGLFHHDGPFDACNPHRNRKRDHRAPMQAFPANSANMAMGGSGPVNKTFDLARFHGYTDEAHKDYGVGYEANSRMRPSASNRAASFDPTARAEPVHGEETMGLGTSTFLEGAPASRKAIERRTSETEPTGSLTGPGLSRKKSLAQRFRGMSQPRTRVPMPNDPYGAPLRSPDARYPNGPATPGSPPQKIPSGSARAVQSAASDSRNYKTEQNPFDKIYDDAYEKKGASIAAAEIERSAARNGEASGFSESKKVADDSVTRVRALSSPRRGSGLDDGAAEAADVDSADLQQKSGGSKLLGRMKSLKGKRPTRPT